MGLDALAAALGGALTDNELICDGRVVMRWSRPTLSAVRADMEAALSNRDAWRVAKGLEPLPMGVV